MPAKPQATPEVDHVEGQDSTSSPAARKGRYPWPMKPGGFIVVEKSEGKSALSAGQHNARRHGTGARYQMRQTDDGRCIIRRVDGLPPEAEA